MLQSRILKRFDTVINAKFLKRNFSGSDLQMEKLTGDLKGVLLLSMSRDSARNAMGKQMMSEVSPINIAFLLTRIQVPLCN